MGSLGPCHASRLRRTFSGLLRLFQKEIAADELIIEELVR